MAYYPDNTAVFSTKTDNVTTIVAADPNSIQSEVVAVQTELGTNPRVSTLGTGGLPTYIPAPTSSSFTTVKARIANIEAGLTNALKTGYTQLSTGSYSAGGTTNISVSDYTYQKLVLVIQPTAVTSAPTVNLKINGSTITSIYTYSRIVHGTSSAPTLTGNYQTSSGFLLGTMTADYQSYVIELPNYASTTAWKTITSLAFSLYLTGFAEDSNRISSLNIVTTGTATYTATLYGVR